MKKLLKLELLAPAGNPLKMRTAFAYGADAVYLGQPDFSLRSRINDFDAKKIKEAVVYAHQRQKKIYATINIFAHNNHLVKLPTHLKELRAVGVDALIVSDPGVINVIKKIWPRAIIHLSTQANCTNLEAVKFWQKQGIQRIILGREVTLKEIKEIHAAVPKMELEYFVHGAMCLAYSGRCFLSKLMTGRSANLGDCAQPCRWEYDVVRLKTGGHEEELEAVAEEHGTYLLNSKDLCLLKYLKDLAAAGITSFKIEGRSKSVYYAATVCGVYHRALSLLSQKITGVKLKKELAYLYQELRSKLINRGYTSGFLLGGRAEQNTLNSHEGSAWEFCGQVLKTEPGPLANRLYFQVHNTIKTGEEIEIIRPDYDIIKIRPLQLWDAKTKQLVKEAHGGGKGQIAILELPIKMGLVPELSVLRRHKQ